MCIDACVCADSGDEIPAILRPQHPYLKSNNKILSYILSRSVVCFIVSKLNNAIRMSEFKRYDNLQRWQTNRLNKA